MKHLREFLFFKFQLNNNSPHLLLEVVEQTEDVESSVPTEVSGHGMVEVETTVASITKYSSPFPICFLFIRVASLLISLYIQKMNCPCD